MTEHIKALKAEAIEHGDLKMAAICCIALGFSRWDVMDMDWPDSMTEAGWWDMSQADAVKECARVITDAAAQRATA